MPDAEHLAMERHARSTSSWRNTTLEVGYVANYGYDLLEDSRRQPGARRRHQRQRRGRSAASTPRHPAATPRCGRSACSATRNIAIWDHSGNSIYHSLQTQFVSRFGRGSQFQASYTLLAVEGELAMTDSGQLAANTTQLDLRTPTSTGAGRRRDARTSSTRRSSGCCRRCEDRAGADAAPVRRLGGRDDRGRRLGPAADGVHDQHARTQRRPVGHGFRRQPAPEPGLGRGVPARPAGPMSRSSTRMPTR